MMVKSFFCRGFVFSLMVALSACFVVPCYGQEAEEEGIVYSVAADGRLNIRQSPSADAPIVGHLLTGGAGAKLLSESGIWYKVQSGDVVGYVNALYVSANRDDERVPNANASRTVYYVVIGSYSTLEAVTKARYSMPDAIDCSPIFLGKKNGKNVYRMCTGVYYTREGAQREVDLLKSTFGFTPWIWKSNGQAQCVDRPIGYDGNPVRITPES